ncbi:hypothetical protein [Rhizobium phage RHEph12]|nr:hypothetical protein [Rhizobium phage RHEph12]
MIRHITTVERYESDVDIPLYFTRKDEDGDVFFVRIDQDRITTLRARTEWADRRFILSVEEMQIDHELIEKYKADHTPCSATDFRVAFAELTALVESNVEEDPA